MQHCKICEGDTKVWGYTDFNKTCNDHPEFRWIGVPITYSKCKSCGLIATDYFDNWNNEMFAEEIYNEDYGLVDPDYISVRPQSNAEFISKLVSKDKTIMDYGGGNGKTAEILRSMGYQATFWDVHSGLQKPQGRFDVVVSIEVFEHTTTPVETFEEAISFLKDDGRLVYTTLTNNNLKNHEMHWYLSPRNGHVLMHSYESLDELGAKFGMVTTHLNNSLHIAQY